MLRLRSPSDPLHHEHTQSLVIYILPVVGKRGPMQPGIIFWKPNPLARFTTLWYNLCLLLLNCRQWQELFCGYLWVYCISQSSHHKPSAQQYNLPVVKFSFNRGNRDKDISNSVIKERTFKNCQCRLLFMFHDGILGKSFQLAIITPLINFLKWL